MLKLHLKDFEIENPSFRIVENSDTYYLEGNSIIFGTDGQIWDDYDIRMIFQKDRYPNSFPKLFELKGKIPNNADWHIFPDGSCCVAISPIMNIEIHHGITINEYYKRYVIPYLANQTYRRLTGSFAKGEYSHGKLGLYEYYRELFKTNDLSIAKLCLQLIYHDRVPGRTNKCFCGSKKKYRHCHKEIIQTLKKIGIENVCIDIGDLI